MKKRLALILAGSAALGFTGIGAAMAEQVATPIGTTYVNEGGYVVFADGSDSNPAPLGGYISVSSGGQVCGDDNGGWGAPGSSPTCSP